MAGIAYHAHLPQALDNSQAGVCSPVPVKFFCYGCWFSTENSVDHKWQPGLRKACCLCVGSCKHLHVMMDPSDLHHIPALTLHMSCLLHDALLNEPGRT